MTEAGPLSTIVIAVSSYCDLTGKNILLLDDIHTSGATIDECYKELKKSNCNFVWAVCLCGVF